MASDWTMERVAKLERDEIEQLRANALGLGEREVVTLCEAALVNIPKRRAASPAISVTSVLDSCTKNPSLKMS